MLSLHTLAPHFLASLTYFLASYPCATYWIVSFDLLSFKTFVYYEFISQGSIMFCLKSAVTFYHFLFLADISKLVFYFFPYNKHNRFKRTSDDCSTKSRGSASAVSPLALTCDALFPMDRLAVTECSLLPMDNYSCWFPEAGDKRSSPGEDLYWLPWVPGSPTTQNPWN